MKSERAPSFLLPLREKESRKERSPRLAEREIDALPAQHGLLAVGQWCDAVKRQPRRAAPYRDVAMLQPKPVRFVAALQSAEQKNRRQAQRHRDDRRGQIKLVLVLMQGHAGAGLVAVDQARVGCEPSEAGMQGRLPGQI